MAIGGPVGTADEPDAEEAETIMEIRDVNVRFSMSRGQAWVLNDVDLDVHRGEIFAIAGESGAGKSTFATTLLDAVEDPGRLTGEITYYPEDAELDTVDEIESFDVAGDEGVELLELDDGELQSIRWEEISMVFQGATESFNPTMRIKSHFHETIRAHNAVLDEQMAHVRELFDALHLDYDRVMDAYPHELSGGMKQRALIALALVLEPDVLVMDEPTAALDLLMQQSIVSMLLDLKEEFDLTIVFVTHDLPLIAGLADRIGVMYGFEFVEIGPVEELLTEAAHPYTRALLRSLPTIDSDIDEMETITGAQPDPINIPTGCSYHPRCPVADDRCEIEEPELTPVDDGGHEAACFYTDQSRAEIDYTLHGGVMEDER